MKQVDVMQSPRIGLLMELVSSLSRLADPSEMLDTLISGIRQAYGARCFLTVSTLNLPPGKYRITRLLSPQGKDLHASQCSLTGESPAVSGGFIGSQIRSPHPKILHDVSLPQDAVLGDALASFRSAMCCPVFNDGSPQDWLFLLDAEPEFFNVHDLEEMILRANLVGAAASNLVLARRLFDANLLIQQDIEQIAAIQRALLPGDTPEIPGLSIAASYETFDRAGGDLYDFIPIGRRADFAYDEPDDRWALLVGDVSGHGPAAAVVMAMFHGILNCFGRRPAGPAEILTHLNRHLSAKPVNNAFVTAFLALYEPATGRLVSARAGHNPPLVSAGGAFTELVVPGALPLGVDAGECYEEVECILPPGESLVLYTDGITESVDASGDMFGVERLIEGLGAAAEPRNTLHRVLSALSVHQGETRPRDDQTLVILKRN